MMKHTDIWRAIDRLAHDRGLTASGLARLSGLDPTTFNKSKRNTRDGKARWPSTESLAKILEATGCTMETLLSFMQDDSVPAGALSARDGSIRDQNPTLRLTTLSQAGDPVLFSAGDAGRLAVGGEACEGQKWDEILFPDIDDAGACALEVDDDALAPLYRAGDRLVVSPAASGRLRRGDRLVIRLRNGEVLVSELVRQTASRLELSWPAAVPPVSRSVESGEIAWIGRILWASQ